MPVVCVRRLRRIEFEEGFCAATRAGARRARRRVALMTSVLALACKSSEPAAGHQTHDTIGEEVTYHAGDTVLNGYLAAPKGAGKHPGVGRRGSTHSPTRQRPKSGARTRSRSPTTRAPTRSLGRSFASCSTGPGP